MQYRSPPLSLGPSLNTWPKCMSPKLLFTSTLSMPRDVSFVDLTTFFEIGLVKLGQPVPESYLSFDENRGTPVTTSTYMPSSLLSWYSFLKGWSVLHCIATEYCSSVSFSSISLSSGTLYLLSSITIFFSLIFFKGSSARPKSIWQ